MGCAHLRTDLAFHSSILYHHFYLLTSQKSFNTYLPTQRDCFSSQQLTQYVTISYSFIASSPIHDLNLNFRVACLHWSLTFYATFSSALAESNPGIYCPSAPAHNGGKINSWHFPEQPPSDRKNIGVKYWDKSREDFTTHQPHSDLLHFTVWTSRTSWKHKSSARGREMRITG